MKKKVSVLVQEKQPTTAGFIAKLMRKSVAAAVSKVLLRDRRKQVVIISLYK